MLCLSIQSLHLETNSLNIQADMFNLYAKQIQEDPPKIQQLAEGIRDHSISLTLIGKCIASQFLLLFIIPALIGIICFSLGREFPYQQKKQPERKTFTT